MQDGVTELDQVKRLYPEYILKAREERKRQGIVASKQTIMLEDRLAATLWRIDLHSLKPPEPDANEYINKVCPELYL